MSAEPRRPQAFEPDDPSLIAEPAPAVESIAMPSADQVVIRPTLAGLGRRGLRWGTLLAASLFGAACLGAAAWFARLVSAALVRDDWIGWTVLAFMSVAAFAALMIALRELIGFSRLSRLNRLRDEVVAAARDRDPKRERRAVGLIAGLYANRLELAWSLSRFREHARDVHDPGELLTLADRQIVAQLDVQALRAITQSAKRVATVTAMSPMVLIAVGFVLIENLRLLRTLASLYGGRPGFLGLLRLSHMVLTHLIATGGVAMTDDLLGQFLGQDLLRRLSRRLGEGAFNGALTARVGVAAIAVIRPMPYLSGRPPRVRDILADALKPLYTPATPTT